MNKKIIQKVKTKNLAKITPHSTKRPVFLAVTGLFSCFETKKMMVELPDTASGSESSRGYHSTHVVFCFVLAKCAELQRTKLSMAMAKF